MAEHDYVALDWVKGELDETLRQARQALEEYVSQPDDPTRLRFCLTHIHQVKGTLNIVEFFGAALLAEEMEKLTQAIMDGKVSNVPEAFGVLMQAIIQLPAYLDRVRKGRRDIPVVLLPLFNDLRTTRGEKLLTEASLFAPNLNIARQRAEPAAAKAIMARADLKELLIKLRQSYQVALISVVRNQNLVVGYSQIAKVFAKLNDVFKNTPISYLWWIGQGLVDGLSSNAIESSPTIRTLFRMIDRELKRLIDGGDKVAVQPASEDLLKNLLFYIARTTVDAPLLRSIKNTFDLENALLNENEIDQERKSLAGPDKEAMKSVVGLLVEEINRIKDMLDIFVRSETKDKQLLNDTLAILKQLSDTLVLLSLGDLRQSIQPHVLQLQAALDKGELLNNQQLKEMAEAVIYLETTLTDLLVVGAPSLPIEKSNEEKNELTPAEKTVITEARNGLEQVRASIVEFVASQWDHKQLNETSNTLEGISGGLRIISLPRAANIAATCAHYVRIIFSNKIVPKWQHLDTLADAIASVEYYLERLIEDGHEKNTAILEIAEQSMSQLGYPVNKTDILQTTDSLPTPTPEMETKKQTIQPISKSFEDNQVDDEIIEIFIEEAREVTAVILESFPAWKADRNNHHALTEFRRAFHTLKGSGRMVSATVLAELAWSVENMLNRVIDNTIEPSDDVVELVETTINVLPTLIEEFQKSILATTLPTEALMARGHALSKGEPVVGRASDLLSAANQHVAQSDTTMVHDINADGELDELLQIFTAESEEHLETIDQFINTAKQEPTLINNALQRALHTLKGSSSMAQILPAADIIAPLDKAARTLWAQKTSVDAVFVSLLEKAAELVRVVLSQLHRTTTEKPTGTDDYLQAVTRFNQDLSAQESNQPVTQTQIQADPAEIANFLSAALDKVMDATDKLNSWHADSLSEEHRASVIADLQELSEAARKIGFNPIHELSDALIALYGSAVLPDDEFFNVTKQAHEELINVMDFVAMGQAIPSTQELIAVLNDAKDIYVDKSLTSAITAEDQLINDIQSTTPSAPEPETASIQSVVVASDDIDPELVSIFLEEANDIQESISDSLEAWIHEPDNKTHVKQLQRDLHTLKGGARMAGITALGDFCHQLENLYEGLGDGRLVANDQLFIMLEKCHDRVASMLQSITQHGGCDQADDLIEAIKNYGKKESSPVSSDKKQTRKETPAEKTDVVPTPAPAVSSAVENASIEEAINQENYDPELVAIFLEEANDILESISSVYDRWRIDPDNVMDVAHLQRDIHTLKGGARMAGIKSLGDFCHQLENLYDGLAASRFEASPHLFVLLEKCHDRIAVMLDSVSTRGQTQSADDLIQAIKAYCANPSVDYAALTQKPSITSDSAKVYSSASLETVDAEVIALFMTEAEELIEKIDHSIHDWRKDPANLAMLDELQRAMHTLKGGARLAGLRELADLSHDCETYLNTVAHQKIQFDDNFFSGLLKRQDEIVAKLAQATHPTPALPAESAPTPTTNKNSAEVIAFVSRKEANVVKEEAPERRADPREPKESVKVNADLLEGLVNLAGETSIARGRIEQGVLDFIGSLSDMETTVLRVKNQLLELDTETQAQITSRHTQIGGREYEDFDPLEMDRYSNMQQLSRSLIETASDLLDLKETLSNKAKDTETLLIQQARINTELQEGLMRTRMVPFSGMVPRLRRIIRQVSTELNKQVEFNVINAEGEMDRAVLERMVAPLEHMLRNAVDHGIEMPADRKNNKKSEVGVVQLKFGRSGGDIVLELSDDGAGIDVEAVRAKAIKLGLLDKKSTLSDEETLQFIMHAGFSTAQKVTQISGRGVGMDVVNSEIKQLGGTMRIQSVRGVGTRFSVHLPFTVSVNRALMVRLGEDMYAVPLNTMRGVVRMNPHQLEAYYQPNAPLYEYGGNKYRVQYLGSLLDHTMAPKIPHGTNSVPLILVPHETQPTALQIDGLMGSREIVVKTVGQQFSGVSGLSGATILGDGSVVVILDFQALIYANLSRQAAVVERAASAEKTSGDKSAAAEKRVLTVMVVDDSVTVRKVTSRLLERHGMAVVTAKDGVDALQQLNDVMPDIMLLDIEMPRMDGFEVATEIRQNPRLKHLPIIMITSRTGDKHRDRAKAIGVNRYMGKPFQEAVLLETIQELVSTDES